MTTNTSVEGNERNKGTDQSSNDEITEFTKLELKKMQEFEERTRIATALAEINKNSGLPSTIFSTTFILKHVMGLTEEEIKLNYKLMQKGL